MPIIKSAKKRVRIAKKATIRNAKTRRLVKEAVKTFQKDVAAGKKEAAKVGHAAAQSAIAKAAKKHVIHKNKAARKQRQLARAAKAAGVNLVGGAKKATAKSPAKKTAAKATPKKTTKK